MTEIESEGIRLQKVLASAGVASRRAAEEMIADGRVEVNGELIVEQGRRVDPGTDVIRVDGSRIPPPRRHRYLVFNKPRGVVTTMNDPEGRRAITDYIEFSERMFHVGRLDAETSGLLVLTNDGEFAHRLSHPSHEIEKTYLADVEGVVDKATINRLSKGIELDDGPVRPDEIAVMSTAADRTMVKVVLHEGRNRIVRRMFDAVGHPVRKLSRTAIGPIKIGQLPGGQFRELSRHELGTLLDRMGL